MEKAHSPLDPSLASKTILVIDDEQLVRESMAIYLEDSGFKVIQAEDGQQGVVLFCEFNPDLVLCDLRMPEMDGMTLLKELSELSPDTPVIIISGVGQIHDVVEALRFGALDYLVKPINDMAVLENAVKNALHRTHLEVENQVYKDELETANHELAKNLDLLQKDQEAGRQAQMQLLPPKESYLKGFHFQHIIIPSLNLSGDFIDYFEISSRYLGFYIADVSGHGSAAAFVTMMLKSLFNQPLRNFKTGSDEIIINPEQLMDYLNNEFINANLGKHITLFYGVIDSEDNTLRYCVAGQYPAPILLAKSGIQLLKDDGFPLGLFEWASFKSQQLNIDSQFQLLMVSDGWLETIPNEASGKPASEQFLLEFINQQPIELSTLLAPVKQYQKKNPPDDVTVFIVEKE
ncbi:MAG: response regulator [Enterobacterales bacterium]|nr:response regulator [Enterobacterales bacterium]